MFVMNIAEFEYIYNFSYTVSSCCGAVQIYYSGNLALRIYESQEHRNCGNLVALALSAAALIMPTRQALAWGSFGSTKVDQRINQLNKCTNQSPDNNYQQSSYDPNSDNKPSTDSSRDDSLTTSDHGNTANQ